MLRRWFISYQFNDNSGSGYGRTDVYGKKLNMKNWDEFLATEKRLSEDLGCKVVINNFIELTPKKQTEEQSDS